MYFLCYTSIRLWMALPVDPVRIKHKSYMPRDPDFTTEVLKKKKENSEKRKFFYNSMEKKRRRRSWVGRAQSKRGWTRERGHFSWKIRVTKPWKVIKFELHSKCHVFSVGSHFYCITVIVLIHLDCKYERSLGNPLLDMPTLGSSNSAANKDMMS